MSSHGLGLIAKDTAHCFYRSEHGVKVVPHHEEWSAYYRVEPLAAAGKPRTWKLILTAFCHGKPPGELVIALRSYEDICRAFGLDSGGRTPQQELVAAAECAVNVLSLLETECEEMGCGAELVKPRLAAAVSAVK